MGKGTLWSRSKRKDLTNHFKEVQINLTGFKWYLIIHTTGILQRRRVSIFGGGSGGQRDNYIHTRVHNMGYAIKLKTVEMCQSSEFADHFVI